MTDFNDIHQAQGPEAVKDAINAAAPVGETIHEAVERLAQLHPLEYDQRRDDEAKKHGVRVSVLDAEVLKKRPADNIAEKQRVGVQEIEPWYEEIEGITLFNDLTAIFKQYMALQKYQAETLALWSIFSYCIDAGNIAPKLLIYSPEKRCGKTTLLDVLIGLVWKPLPSSNITPAAIYRVIEHIGGTIVIDEADTFINNPNSEINGIINSGHRKSAAYVLRCQGDEREPKQFSTWAPNIIAMIGKPKDTIVDRSILIEMKRKKHGDSVQRFIPHKAETELKILASKIARWSQDNFENLCNADPETPTGLNDRAADNWRPLLAIADLIGGVCSEIARLAALTLAENEQDEDNASVGGILLADIKDIFESGRRERISTEDLLFALHAMEDRPWPEWNRGKPISARQVSTKLKPFGISSKTLRVGYGNPQKGYDLKDFEDVFPRYLPDLSVTASQFNETNGCSDISIRNTEQNVTDENASKTAKNRHCYGVTGTEVF